MSKVFVENEYVLWVEFDENTTQFMNEKCKELECEDIKAGVRPPHLTLTFVQCDDEQKLIEEVQSLEKDISSFPLFIKFVGSFMGNVLFYAPQTTNKLLLLQEKICNKLRGIGELSWNLYFPEQWTPHIALTGSLDEEAAQKAFRIMMSGFSCMEAKMKTIHVKRCFGDGAFVLKKAIE